MKIKINNVEWEIKELTNEEMNEFISKYRKYEDYEYYCGYTSYIKHVILLNKIAENNEHTLYHELVHAYLYSYGLYDFETYSEEDVCNIASRSSIIINQIMNEYFKK